MFYYLTACDGDKHLVIFDKTGETLLTPVSTTKLTMRECETACNNQFCEYRVSIGQSQLVIPNILASAKEVLFS